MAEPMGEQRAVAGVDEDPPGGRVDLARGGADDRRGAAGVMRGVDRRVDVVVGVRRLADHDHPRDVARVARDLAADVDHDRVAGFDHAVADHVVRNGAVRRRADDHLVDRVVPAVDQQPLEVAPDLTLGAARPGEARQLAEHAVDGDAGRAQGVLLARVLHRAELLEQRARRHELRAGGGLQR